MASDFAVQLIQRGESSTQDFVAPGCEAINPRSFGAFRLRRPQPAALRHARQHRVQRARTQAVPMAVQFFEHPLTVDALFIRVMKNVNLPECQQEFADNRIPRHLAIIAPPFRRRVGYVTE